MRPSKLFQGNKELVFVTELARIKIERGRIPNIETIFAGRKPGVWYARIKDPNPTNDCIIFIRRARRLWETKRAIIGSATYNYLCQATDCPDCGTPEGYAHTVNCNRLL